LNKISQIKNLDFFFNETLLGDFWGVRKVDNDARKCYKSIFKMVHNNDVCDVHVFSSLLAKGGLALWGTLDIS
jgi:hypothetical protein